MAVLQGRDRKVYWAAYGCAVLVCGLLNWLSLLILPAHLAPLMWARVAPGVRVRWAVASAAATAGVSPLILFSRSQSAQVSWIPPLTWHMLIGPMVLLAIAGLGTLLDRPRTGRLSAAAVGLPLLAVPQLGLVGLSLFQPLLVDRYVLFSLVGLALMTGVLLGAAVRVVSRRSVSASRWVLPALVVVLSIALLPQSLAKRSPASRVDDVLSAAAQVERLKEDGDAVLFLPAARRDTRMVSPDAFTGLHDIALAESPQHSGTLKAWRRAPHGSGRRSSPSSASSSSRTRRRSRGRRVRHATGRRSPFCGSTSPWWPTRRPAVVGWRCTSGCRRGRREFGPAREVGCPTPAPDHRGRGLPGMTRRRSQSALA